MNWFPWHWSAGEIIAYAVYCFVVTRLMHNHPAALVPLAVGLFGWPYLIKYTRLGLNRLFVGLRTSGRKPGQLICPECGGILVQIVDEGMPAARCPACEGKWSTGAELSSIFAAKNRTIPAWSAFKKKDGRLESICPKCANKILEGSFVGADYACFYCPPCDGYWLSNVDWVTMKLALSEPSRRS